MAGDFWYSRKNGARPAVPSRPARCTIATANPQDELCLRRGRVHYTVPSLKARARLRLQGFRVKNYARQFFRRC